MVIANRATRQPTSDTQWIGNLFGILRTLAHPRRLTNNERMLHRPWSIVLFTWGHILAPFVSWFFTMYYLRIPISHADAVFYGMKWFTVFRWFALMPLAGLAIYQMKPWSFPIFTGALGLQLYTNYVAWARHPRAFSIALFLVYFVIDGAIVGYLLRPSVRRIFFEKSMRWWESRPRYQVRMPLEIMGLANDLPVASVLTGDFSVGGLFVPFQPALADSAYLSPEVSREVRLRLRFGRSTRALQGQIVHQGKGNSPGLGISFHRITRADHLWLLFVAAYLSVRRVPKRVIARRNWREFWNWVGTWFGRPSEKTFPTREIR